jgi:hypothetical protein
MTSILAQRAAETRAAGEAMIREADGLLCQSWNERMWADGEPVDPSPTVDQAINGGYPWLGLPVHAAARLARSTLHRFHPPMPSRGWRCTSGFGNSRPTVSSRSSSSK